MVLEGSSVYFFQNGNGDFLPASAQIEYLSEEGTWLPVSENRMGCDADTFNTITFDKITTTSIRMIMKPALREAVRKTRQGEPESLNGRQWAGTQMKSRKTRIKHC